MKNLLLTIVLLLSTSASSLGNDPKLTYNSNSKEAKSICLESIFYSNQEEDLIFIDFQSIPMKILNVTITRENAEMMIEDVEELNQEMIYEIDLTIFTEGNYTVELHLEGKTVIKKQISVL